MAKTIRSADFRLTARQILQAKNRPQTEPWEDWVTMALSVVTLFAVFWDGWLHNNSTDAGQLLVVGAHHDVRGSDAPSAAGSGWCSSSASRPA